MLRPMNGQISHGDGIMVFVFRDGLFISRVPGLYCIAGQADHLPEIGRDLMPRLFPQSE